MISEMQVSYILHIFSVLLILCLLIAVIFFTNMLGPAEEGKISHVTEIEISERATGKTMTDPGPPEVYVSNVKLFKEKLAGNKPKKGKRKGKGKKKKKK